VLLISGNATFVEEYVKEMRYGLLEKPAAVADILHAVRDLIGTPA
jgi:hypothetical protein